MQFVDYATRISAPLFIEPMFSQQAQRVVCYVSAVNNAANKIQLQHDLGLAAGEELRRVVFGESSRIAVSTPRRY
jgi:hypothetical protein